MFAFNSRRGSCTPCKSTTPSRWSEGLAHRSPLRLVRQANQTNEITAAVLPKSACILTQRVSNGSNSVRDPQKPKQKHDHPSPSTVTPTLQTSNHLTNRIPNLAPPNPRSSIDGSCGVGYESRPNNAELLLQVYNARKPPCEEGGRSLAFESAVHPKHSFVCVRANHMYQQQ